MEEIKQSKRNWRYKFSKGKTEFKKGKDPFHSRFPELEMERLKGTGLWELGLGGRKEQRPQHRLQGCALIPWHVEVITEQNRLLPARGGSWKAARCREQRTVAARWHSWMTGPCWHPQQNQGLARPAAKSETQGKENGCPLGNLNESATRTT